jgi:type II secretory pathway pseudopilin PulG
MIGIVICLIVAAIVSYAWANAIDKQNKNFPDYKGDDFLEY